MAMKRKEEGKNKSLYCLVESKGSPREEESYIIHHNREHSSIYIMNLKSTKRSHESL